MRAADGIEKICRQHPEWLSGYIPRLLDEVSKIDQPSVQWHLAQMIGTLNLQGRDRVRALKILRKNLFNSGDWIVINYTLQTLADLAVDDTQLRKELIPVLKKYRKSSYKSIASRARKLLTVLNDSA